MSYFLTQRLRLIASSVIISLLCFTMQGCVKHSYTAKPVSTSSVLNEINSWNIDNPDLNQFLLTNGLTSNEVSGNTFSIKRLFLTSLYYDPEMQVAYKRWKKAQIAVEHTGNSINPEISIPLEHHSEARGISEWTIGAVLSFIYERKGKREARLTKAKVELFNAELEITRHASERYAIFEEKYHSYLIAKAKITETESEINVLEQLLEKLEKKYELGAVSQFELSTTKLDLQRRFFHLTLQKNNLQENVDELLALTYLTHTELDDIEIEYIPPIFFAKQAYQNTAILDADLPSLQKIMLDTHFDMAVVLNEYAVSEADLRLEIESQYPDLVLSPGFIFDQSDNIWALGTSWVLPLFENSKQNVNILTALEERKVKQQEVVATQKKLLSFLYRSHKSVIRHRSSINVSDEIIDSIEQRAKEIENQIEIGGIDNVALLRNRVELYKARQAQTDIYKEAIDAMLFIETLITSPHAEIDMDSIVSSWLSLFEEKNNNEIVN
jgi:outer membrane protein, heavy metal efflux system